jgi:hypothetical protein
VNAVTPGAVASSIFDDHDRARANQRLEAIDLLGARRLLDALWPAEDDRNRASIRLARDDELKEPPR